MILEDASERGGNGLARRKCGEEEDVTYLEFSQLRLKCLWRASKGELPTLNFDTGPVEFVEVVVQRFEVTCLNVTGSLVCRRASILAYEDSDHVLQRQQACANFMFCYPFEARIIELGQQDEFHHVVCYTYNKRINTWTCTKRLEPNGYGYVYCIHTYMGSWM